MVDIHKDVIEDCHALSVKMTRMFITDLEKIFKKHGIKEQVSVWLSMMADFFVSNFVALFISTKSLQYSDADKVYEKFHEETKKMFIKELNKALGENKE